MTYNEIYEKAKAALANADAKSIFGKMAIEFCITGEGEGRFYVLVDGGKVYVEPYDYVDNDARFVADAETLIKIVEGTLKPETAYSTGDLKIEGNVSRGLEFKALVESVPAPKAAAPKRKRRTPEEIAADKAAKEAAKAEKEAAKAA
ncbi:MAG: SCP2 sterol-binding domain-containing protein, partial [Clostridia bacterium]